MGQDLNSLLPDLQGDLQALHAVLLPVCLVLGFGGFVREIFLAQARGSVSLLPGYLVKMLDRLFGAGADATVGGVCHRGR